jgi:GNAT superfamily N-acetyltransferase
MKIQSATDETSIDKCFEVMHALRPHLTKETFAKLILDMIKNGYHLLYIEEDGKAVCALGFRYAELLAWGKAIYIDDLSTLPQARGKGYASALLDYIFQLAKEKNCDQVHLDSGCFEARYNAHRLYLNKGFNITSHHFAKKMKQDNIKRF